MTSEIEHDLGPKASVVSYVSDAEQAVSSLGSVKSIALDSLVGALAAAVVILFLVMVMIVRERKREIGIQKAIGTPNGQIMAQFTTEALTFTLLGLVVGRRHRDHRGEPGDLFARLAQRGVVRHRRPGHVRRGKPESRPSDRTSTCKSGGR